MSEMINFKHIVKLFLLMIAVGLATTVIPDTFSETAQLVQIGNYINDIHVLKSDLIENVDQTVQLNEENFTANSWAQMKIILNRSQQLLENFDHELLNLNVLENEEPKKDSEAFLSTVETNSNNLADKVILLQLTLMELTDIYLELEEAYENLVLIDDSDAYEQTESATKPGETAALENAESNVEEKLEKLTIDTTEISRLTAHFEAEIAPTSDSGIPTLFTGEEPGIDFHNVATETELQAALTEAPITGHLRVINLTENIALSAAPSVANGRTIAEGRNVVIQSIESVTLTTTSGRHFIVIGASSRLIINEGITLTRTNPNARTAASAAGGIATTGGRVTLNGGIIHGNHQTVNEGGGIFVNGASAVFEMFSGILSENSSNYRTHGAFGSVERAGGGGVLVNNGTFNFHGGLITRNRTDNSGGAILLRTTNATMNMYGGVIYQNWNGGHWGIDITANTSHGAAAGSGQGAGAMDMSNGPTFNMYGGLFLDNFTSGHGGDGGAIEAGTDTATNRPTINLFGGTFRGNHGRQGGAINAHRGTDVRLHDPITVTDPLGVLAVQPYLATGVIFEENIASGLGGAIVTRGGTTPGIIMDAGTLRNNRAQGDAPTDSIAFGPRGSGGAIALADGTGAATFIMNGGLIYNNTANNNASGTTTLNTNQGGGGVYIGLGKTFTMNGGRIVNNETGQRAGATSAETPFSGGGGVHNRGTFNFNGGEITGNRSGHITTANSGGGGIYIAAGAVFNLPTSTTQRIIDGNHSATTGGGIFMPIGAAFTLATPAQAAALGLDELELVTDLETGYLLIPVDHLDELPDESDLVVPFDTFELPMQLNRSADENLIFSNNTAVSTGGAISFNAAAGTALTINLNGGLFYNNSVSAGSGGTIGLLNWGTAARTFNFGGASFINNSASVDGGILSITEGTGAATITVTAGEFRGNQADVNGGVFNIHRINTTAATLPAFSMNGGVMRNNTAENGAGIYYAPTLNLAERGTGASTTGTAANTQFNISGTAVAEDINYIPIINHSRAGSGAMTNSLQFNLSQTATLGGLINIAPRLTTSGAGTGTHNNTFTFNMVGNTIVETGLVFGEHPLGANLDMVGIGAGGGVRTNNFTATFSGGTVYGGVDFVPNIQNIGGSAGSRLNDVTFNLTGGTISGRKTENGGAIRYEPRIEANNGAVAAINRVNTSHFNLDNGIIRDGIATNNGGGVYHRPHSILPTGGTLGTHSINMRMRQITVMNNTADNNGGGLYMDFTTTGGTVPIPTFNLSETGHTRRIIGNTADNNGGGLLITERLGGIESGSISGLTGNTIINTIIEDNTATTGLGGGVCIESGSLTSAVDAVFTVINSSISGNTSYLDGASIWLNSVERMTLTNSFLDRNITITGDGAGLYFNPLGSAPTTARILTLNGTSFSLNHALDGNGGGIFIDSAQVTITDADFEDNRAIHGGGIYGINSTISIPSGQFMGNVATNNGGVIFVDGGQTTTTDVIFEKNSATHGGGIYATDTTFSISDGSFTENHATNGGGIYLEEDATLVATNTSFTNNTATSHGGAIFTEDYEYFVDELSPTSYSNLITNAYFNDNTAFRGFTSPTLKGQAVTASNVSSSFNPINNDDINFERHMIDFEFIKTDQLLYVDPEFATTLEGAVFKLYVWNYVAGEGFNWILVEEHVVSDEAGRASFAALEVGLRYRLVETEAPTSPTQFALPEGHWYVYTANDRTISITRSLENPEDPTSMRPDVPFIQHENQWYVGNMPAEVDFVFYKTEEDVTVRLAEGYFSLYRQNEVGIGWETEAMATDISTADGLVEFEGLSRGGIYRLIETQAPPGFITPRHNYWKITVGNDGVITIATHGHGQAEDFVRCGVDDEDWCLPNIFFVPITSVQNNTTLYLGLALTASLSVLGARRYYEFKKKRQLI